MKTVGCQADASVLLPSDSVPGSCEVRSESVLGASVLAALVSVGIWRGTRERPPPTRGAIHDNVS